MDKLKVEDFYNWYPRIEMLNQPFWADKKSIDFVIKIEAVFNFEIERTEYQVTIDSSVAEESCSKRFKFLEDAVDYYNNKMEEMERRGIWGYT